MGQRGTVRARDYNFFCGKGNEKSSIGKKIFCTLQNSISSYKSTQVRRKVMT